MQYMIWAGALVAFSTTAALAQPAAGTIADASAKATDSRQMSREEIDVLYAAAQKREDAENERRGKLMAHWTSAVCVGCGPVPEGFRAVRTNPLRVLAGVPAWMDDESAATARVNVRLGSGAARRRIAGSSAA